MSEEEFFKRKALVQRKLDERLNLLNGILDSRTPKSELVFLKVIIVLLALFILWIQPWESPAEKISDEWKKCNNKYAGHCSYVGKKFKTNSFEMAVSEFLHGKYGDEDCSHSRQRNFC